MTNQQGAPGQTGGQGQPSVDPSMGTNPDNPNNEQDKPGYDPNRPTVNPGDPGYQEGRDDQGRATQRPAR